MGTLFSDRTAIIVGAGASYDFGAPLGGELWRRVAHACSEYSQTRRKHDVKTGTGRRADQFLKEIRHEDPKAFAYFSAVRAEDSELRVRPLEIADVVHAENFHTSVDEFLRDQPSLVPSLRTLIAGNIFEGLYERDDHVRAWRLRAQCKQVEFNNLWGSSPQSVRNWIRLFVGVCRSSIRNSEPVKVTVISFNYDRLFETTLRAFWRASETRYPDFDDCFDFLYPYGAFQELPETVVDAGNWILQQSAGIGLAGVSGGNALANIQESLRAARQIFALGFSFSSANVELLGLDHSLGPRVFAQNYDNADKRLSRVLSGLSAPPADPGSLSDLMVNGFFEQPAPRKTPEPYVG